MVSKYKREVSKKGGFKKEGFKPDGRVVSNWREVSNRMGGGFKRWEGGFKLEGGFKPDGRVVSKMQMVCTSVPDMAFFLECS